MSLLVPAAASLSIDPRGAASARLLRWTGTALAASALASALLSGLYILAFYAGSAGDGHTARWNDMLPRLYESQTPVALAIGSWLYRTDYGVWMLPAGGTGHTTDFRGPFDVVMAFWFYLPNLLVADAFSRARRRTTSPALRLAAAGVLTSATGVVLLGTYYFTELYWGPAILSRVTGG